MEPLGARVPDHSGHASPQPFLRRLALAATLIAVGVLATLALLATLVAHTL
jgi:hypothetical protein